MANINDLIPRLANLPRREYTALIRQVDERRRQAAKREAQQHWPRNGMSKEEFVTWIARQHFAIDKGIARILYLPTGAPAEEVRLLEANALASLPENGPVEAVDFMPDIEGVHYTLFVADVTPRQLDAILNRQLPLPNGWQLDGYQEIAEADQ
jgi:hypothetical protein